MTEMMQAAIVCREMKWTYEQYLNSPAPFIDTIVSMMNEEARAITKRKK